MTERSVKVTVKIFNFQKKTINILTLLKISAQMKHKVLIFVLLISTQINAQKDIKIVKIDNSKYPKIEMLIKSTKVLDTSKLTIFEGTQRRNYLTTDVPYKDIKKETRILFLINDFEINTVKTFLKGEILKLKQTDKINFGIMSKEGNGKIHIYYIAPEFSQNKQFFINYFDGSYIDLNYTKTNNCKTEKKIQTYLFSDHSDLKNTGIIIIGNFEKNDLNFCSGIQKGTVGPVYVLQTKPLKKEKEDQIIKICMKSGGMYTQGKLNTDGFKILKRYKEDLSIDPFNTMSNLKKVIFQISGKNNETNIKINYEKETQLFIIKKPKRKKISRKELFLTVFSSILFVFVLLLLFKNRKNKMKSEKKEVELQPMNITLSIEINVKGKGLNKTYFFEKHLIRIGRNSDNDIVISDATVSGNHAIINKQEKEFVIQDLGSTNGVIVNQKKIKKKILKSNDKIKLGAVVLYVRF